LEALPVFGCAGLSLFQSRKIPYMLKARPMHRPRRPNSSRALKNAASAARTSYQHLDRAASALGKWMTTDHTGFSRSLSNMPPLGFKEACHYILVRFLIMLAGAVLSGAIVFVMIAFGIPALLSFLLSP